MQPDALDSDLISSLKEKLLNKLYAKFGIQPLEKAVTREKIGEIRKEIQQMAAGCHNPQPDTQNDSESESQPPPVKRVWPDGETTKTCLVTFLPGHVE